MKYFVNVGRETIEVELGSGVLVDGTRVEAELSGANGTPVRLLKVGTSVRPIVVRPGVGAGRWLITIAGRTTEVTVLDERTRALAAVVGDSRASRPTSIVAPMPGLVVRVNVAPGDRVAEGQGVVVVEAMKMENELRATAEGTVASVHVDPGATVEKGAVLVTFE